MMHHTANSIGTRKVCVSSRNNHDYTSTCKEVIASPLRAAMHCSRTAERWEHIRVTGVVLLRKSLP